MMDRRVANSMMMNMSGTAITPLTTAAQNNALIGSTREKSSTMPAVNAAPMTP